MADKSRYQIQVAVNPFYLEERSAPEQERYAFGYQVNVHNAGTVAAQLRGRHWLITDSNGETQEVEGEGVVGQQPYLRPGETFEYTSWTVLDTPVGTMEGRYDMVADDGANFSAEIPAFTLAMPRTLH